MSQDYIILDEQIGIRKIEQSDVTDKYVKWLNDPEVNKYLECRHTVHSLESTIKYVDSLNEDNEILLGIFDSNNNRHIGNIKIGPINKLHKQATIGLIIGEKEYWGKGIGTKVIKYVSRYAIESLGIETLIAGCYECNKGSYKAFINSGWKKVGTIKNYWKYGDGNESKTGQVLMQYEKSEEIKIPAKGGMTLIGGGKLMKDFAVFAQKYCDVLVVVSRRHHDKEIEQELELHGCSYHISEDINNDHSFDNIARSHSRICICFGPAWIFESKIINLFSGRIFNFNGIPLPRYTGGAHYTWQILNRSREGGAYIQQITTNIDRGGIVKHIQYQLDEIVKLPKDYERENTKRGFEFLKEFFEDLHEKDKYITLNSHLIDWSEKRYYPRLLTSINGWINWQWSGKEIVRFCEAFGDPYGGANTTVNGHTRITIRSIKLVNNEYYHPFCYGLIINRIKDKSIFVASSDGLLVCDDYQIKDYDLNVGDRLETPVSILEESRRRIRFGSNGVEE